MKKAGVGGAQSAYRRNRKGKTLPRIDTDGELEAGDRKVNAGVDLCKPFGILVGAQGGGVRKRAYGRETPRSVRHDRSE